MNKLFASVILLISFMVNFGWTVDSTETKGKEILEKADRRFYPENGSYLLYVKTYNTEGKEIHGNLQCYKFGVKKQTAVYSAPIIYKDMVLMRSGETIYVKQPNWSKPDLASYQSTFMESTFSYGDIVSTEIANDYKVTMISNTTENNKEVYYMVLSPRNKALYARIDVWIDVKTFDTYKRLYYTASGDKLKMALYTDIVEKDGNVVSFNVSMEDFFLNVKNYAEITDIKTGIYPKFLFDPQSIGRIRAK